VSDRPEAAFLISPEPKKTSAKTKAAGSRKRKK
jgi:hypothetical protein